MGYLQLSLVSASSASAQQAGPESALTGKRIIFTVVEQHPEFPGGSKALQKYLTENLKYPEGADKKFRDQTFFTTFIINETGAIDSARVLKPINAVVDAEVVRTIENMPAWIPGKQKGQNVTVRYNIPVRFSKR